MPTVIDSAFYVYEHWRPDTDVCFYVGKGSGARAWQTARRNPHHRNIIAKLVKAGSAPEVRLVASGLSEASALALEIERIAFWRSVGVQITNITKGGEGTSGLRHSAETRIKMRAKRALQSRERHRKIMRGRKHSPAHVERISQGLRGREVSPETRTKIRNSNVGQKRSAQTKAKLKTSHLGKTARPETKKKMSDRQSARWARMTDRSAHNAAVRASFTPEIRAKLSESATRRFVTPEAREKLREYALRRWRKSEPTA